MAGFVLFAVLMDAARDDQLRLATIPCSAFV
jgi:hypothetical protein